MTPSVKNLNLQKGQVVLIIIYICIYIKRKRVVGHQPRHPNLILHKYSTNMVGHGISTSFPLHLTQRQRTIDVNWGRRALRLASSPLTITFQRFFAIKIEGWDLIPRPLSNNPKFLAIMPTVSFGKSIGNFLFKCNSSMRPGKGGSTCSSRQIFAGGPNFHFVTF